MKTQLKKSTYLFALFFVSAISILFHILFFPKNSVTSDHATLTLTPFTAHEQKALIKAQEQEAQSDPTAPLIASMSVPDAQARVLNLNRSVKSPA